MVHLLDYWENIFKLVIKFFFKFKKFKNIMDQRYPDKIFYPFFKLIPDI